MENVSSDKRDGASETNGSKGNQKADKSRSYRLRRAYAEDVAGAIGSSDPAFVEALIEIDRCKLDPAKLSLSGSFEDRLNSAVSFIQSYRGSAFYPNSRELDYDPARDADRRFRENSAVEKMVSSEMDLLRLIVANAAVASAIQSKADEHLRLQAVLETELSRRRTLAEGWRYQLPKAVLPLYSALHVGKIGRDKCRSGSSFMREFIDLVARHAAEGVTRADLVEACEITAEQFEQELRSAQPADGSSETFTDLQARLERELDRIGEELQAIDQDDAEGVEQLQAEMRALTKVSALGGGIDAAGRIQFKDALALMERLGESQSAASGKTERSTNGMAADPDETPLPSPEVVANWPTSIEDPRVVEAMTVRTTGFGSTPSSEPFVGYLFNARPAPFSFVPMRHAEARKVTSGVLEPADLVRIEVPKGLFKVEQLDGHSPVLGRGHQLMLPPHASAEWYGQQLGWGEQDLRKIQPFGNAGSPDSISTSGSVEKLEEALAGVASLQLRKLITAQPEHLLADSTMFNEAVQDLARWWMFVLFARHCSRNFEIVMPGAMFHGVHGPDFVIEDGRPVFGDSHFRIQDPMILMREGQFTDKEIVDSGRGERRRRRIGVLAK
ncbi:hypothetical protein [Croceicoccus gelatinilyticus]|uniref:hypothetical protein n=1 Tax=Croceicoccus gelatinilyticus TaxID=2835536 RepID=UPI001BCB5746|nr:hypothetical protein [Croceicoccus gelatinilyticus]MBS7671539.1 hypothetical protein [Croceicoccus gelatinilyticus]